MNLTRNFKLLSVFVLALAGVSPRAFANDAYYTALTRCEGSAVVVDEVRNNQFELSHYQVVVHGAELAQAVRSEVYGELYDGGATLVIRVVPNNVRNADDSRKVSDGIYLFKKSDGQLQVYQRFQNIDGGRNSGDYTFFDCQSVH